MHLWNECVAVCCSMLQCVVASAKWRVHRWYDSFMCDMPGPYAWHKYSFMRDMTHACVTEDPFMCDMTYSFVTWHIHICDMTHSYVWHDAFICVTWLIHMCDMSHSYGTWLTHMGHATCIWNMPHSCAARLFCMWDMTHSYGTWLIHKGHDSFICVTLRIHMWHDSFIWDVLPLFEKQFEMKSSWNKAHEYLAYLRHASFICDLTHSLIYMWHNTFTDLYAT